MAGWIVVAVVVMFLLVGGTNGSSSSRSSGLSSQSRRMPPPPRFTSSATAKPQPAHTPRHAVSDRAPQPDDRCTCGGQWIRRENGDSGGRFWGCSNYPRCHKTRDEVMRARHGPYWKEAERPELARCSNGHPRTSENTAFNAAGHRICLDCRPTAPTAPPAPKQQPRVVEITKVAPQTSAPNSAVGACRNGHPRTPENTYVRPDGERECRICRKLARRR